MNFKELNFDKWERKEHFAHYNNQINCMFNLTSTIDVTLLKEIVSANNLKFYQTFIYIVTNAVNQSKEFKLGRNEQGCLGYYDKVSASYLLFHDDDKTFTSAFTEYEENFQQFYKRIISDCQRFEQVKGFKAIEAPANSFPVSCLPWVKFTGFNLNLPLNNSYFAPIITWGRYEYENGKLEMPVSIQINHAAADGYHVAMLLNSIQLLCNNFESKI